MTTSANERQVGGEHYKRDGLLEHWDLIERSGIGYLEGCATKYVARWRQKGGVQDLEKAEHYVQKLIELHDEGVRLPRGVARMVLVGEFCRPLQEIERAIIFMLCRWDCRDHLLSAQSDLRHLIELERRISNPPQYRVDPPNISQNQPNWSVERLVDGVWRHFEDCRSEQEATALTVRLNG